MADKTAQEMKQQLFGGMMDAFKIRAFFEKTEVRKSTKNETWRGYTGYLTGVGKTYMLDARNQDTLDMWEKLYTGHMVEVSGQLSIAGFDYGLAIEKIEVVT